jgi:hypothetical protein
MFRLVTAPKEMFIWAWRLFRFVAALVKPAFVERHDDVSVEYGSKLQMSRCPLDSTIQDTAFPCP